MHEPTSGYPSPHLIWVTFSSISITSHFDMELSMPSPMLTIALVLTVLISRACTADENGAGEGVRRIVDLFGLGPDIDHDQYRELCDLYIELNVRFEPDNSSFSLLEAIMKYYTELQEELLDDAIRIGSNLVSLPISDSRFAEFNRLCVKIDVFRTKTGSHPSSGVFRHLEDSEKFQQLERLRERILMQRRRESHSRHFLDWLFSCFSTPNSNSGHNPEEQSGHNPEEGQSSRSSVPNPSGNRIQSEDAQPEVAEPDYEMFRFDDFSDGFSLMLVTSNLVEIGLLPVLRYRQIPNSLQEALSLSDEIDVLLAMPFNRPALHLSGYPDEDCEQFLQLLEEFEPDLNLDLYKMQTMVKNAGLLMPSQIREWRRLYRNFFQKVKQLDIDIGILQHILSILKKREKNQEDRAVEETFLNRGRQVAKCLNEMAKIDRSMEIKRRLPNCWQTYCNICVNPFQSGKNLSPMELLEFKPETRAKVEHAENLSVIERELSALEEPDDVEESISRKAAILPSAIEESEQDLEEQLPQDIVFCGLCGYRICRKCVEKVLQDSACKCLICGEVLMVPTVATLKAVGRA